MKKIIIVFLFLFLIATPICVSAQTSLETQTILDQLALLKEQLIQELIKQISILQKQLEDMIAIQSSQSNAITGLGTAVQEVSTNVQKITQTTTPVETNVVWKDSQNISTIGENFKISSMIVLSPEASSFSPTGIAYSINGGEFNKLSDFEGHLYQDANNGHGTYAYKINTETIIPLNSTVSFAGTYPSGVSNHSYQPWIKSITLIGQTTGKIITLP